MLATRALAINKRTITGAAIFTSGILINEIFLMTQGVAALYYTNIPFINQALLIAAIIMFSGLLLLVLSQKKNSKVI